MVPNGASYNNYPPFGTNGTKTPPGGSTESAKYALGMVPADTFPAEWANYLFYGATQGITRLNQDTGSIKKEINTVLACKNITPDATACDQLYCALLKIRDDAVALAYPVGTVYMNAKSATLPAEIQAIGTWCAIDGRFLRACASCLGCTGGVTSGSVTLAVCIVPSDCHSVGDHKHSGTVDSHCHSIGDHRHGGTVGCHCHSMDHSHNMDHGHSAQAYYASSGGSTGFEWHGSGGSTGSNAIGKVCVCSYSGSTGGASNSITSACQPSFTGGWMCAAANTGNKQPGFTGGAMCAAVNTGNTGCGCSFSILPSYRDVAMWYRDA